MNSRSDIEFCSTALVLVNILLSLVCLLQYFHVFTRGAIFPAVSDFDNPAGVASLLCLTLPFSVTAFCRYNRKNLVFLFVGLVDVLVLFIICSRTGLIAVTLVMVVYLIHMWKCLGRRIQIVFLSAFVLIIPITIVLFNQKTASSVGRMLILDVCLDMFRDSPWFGFGHNGFARNYMIYQAEFLSSVNDSDLLLLSGNVSHPLCEYVLLLVNHGLIGFGLMMSIILIIVYFSVRSDANRPFFLMFVVSLAILSGFSYPFRYPMTVISICTGLFIVWNGHLNSFLNSCMCFIRVFASFVALVITLFVSVPWMYAQYAWGEVTSNLLSDRSSANDLRKEIIPITDHYLLDNPRYRYSRAVVNYYSGFLDEALTDATESSKGLPSYDTELLMGDICSALGWYQESELHYLKASRMCPSRITPLYCLFKMYGLSGNVDAERRVGKELLGKPIKIMNDKARSMRLEVRMKMALPLSSEF